MPTSRQPVYAGGIRWQTETRSANDNVNETKHSVNPVLRPAADRWVALIENKGNEYTMNRAVIFIVLFFAFAYSDAQPYHPLIKTNSTWDQYYNILPVLCYSYGERLFFEPQDTVINGLNYKACKSQQLIQLNPGPFCPPFGIDSVSYTVAYLREDTITRRVYINASETGNADELLYDFNLNVGDTLHSNYLGSGETIVIEAIEEILLNTGEARKKFVVNSQLNSSYIEGIGNTYGLFTQIPVSFCECAGGYFCIKQNGVNVMGSGGYCDFQYVGVKSEPARYIEIIPNPVGDKFSITIPAELVGFDFEVYSLVGAVSLRKTMHATKGEFDISDLPAGLYFYRIGAQHNIIKGKVVKK